MSQFKKTKIIQATEQYSADLDMGLSSEQRLINFLNKDIEADCLLYRKYQDRFSLFDIYNIEEIGEIKTRRNSKDKYPTTMVGYNKVKIAEENKDLSIHYRFYFIFTDGTYYWDYCPLEFSTGRGGRTDRGCAEIKQYAYIKIEDLTFLTAEVKSVS